MAKDEQVTCPSCGGCGTVEVEDVDGDGEDVTVIETCADCGGSGIVG